MFTRDQTLQRLLQLAGQDPQLSGVAVTGSHAAGTQDRWSDIDLAVGVHGALETTIDRWTRLLYDDFRAVHHWDLPAGTAIYRVFLLPEGLEVDIGFSPAADFRQRGPHWRLVAGTSEPAAPPPDDSRAGLAWHHALHARAALERGDLGQADHWIGALRTQIAALTDPPDEAQLRRALAAATRDLLVHLDPDLAAHLRPLLPTMDP